MNSSKRFFLVLLIVAVGISAAMLWRVYAGKSEYREMYKGDIGTELNAYTAGLNFARHGFANLYFLPATQRYDDSLDALLRKGLYTHFPPGPDLMCGLLQVLGVHGFYQQKICLLPVNLAALLLLVLAVRRLLPGEKNTAPFVVAALVLTSVWFIWWAGNLHEHPYNDLFMALAVWAVVVQKERLYLLVCFLALLFSFEPVPWLSIVGVFMATQRVTAKTWNPRQALMFLAGMVALFFIAFGLHVFQNACYFHSLTAAINDLRGAYRTRAEVIGTGINEYSAAKQVVKGIYATLWFYGASVLILAGIGLNASIKKRQWLPVVLLCAGFAWPIAFRQHSMIHALTWRHLGLGLFLLATIGFVRLWEQTPLKKGVALLLLLGAMVRVPAGCELSRNAFFLGQLRQVVANTDSATIAELINFFKDNPEHALGKQILINELAARSRALPDQPAYTIVMNGKPVTLVRDRPGHAIQYRNLPADRTPVFHDSIFPYMDATGPRYEIPPSVSALVHAGNSMPEEAPIQLAVTGSRNATRYRLLLAWLLLQ